jgi:GAF domain-containing protein
VQDVAGSRPDRVRVVTQIPAIVGRSEAAKASPAWDLRAHGIGHLALLLVANDSLGGVLGQIAHTAQKVITRCDGASVSADGGRTTIWASTDAVAERLDQHQLRTAEGPCLDAVRTGQASFLDSMALAQRWPTFTPLAFAEGIIGLYSFPLKVGEETIGALNLHSRSRPLAFPDLRAASALAVQAAVTLANARAYDEARSRVAQLERALAARVADVRTRSVVRGRQC